MATLKPLLRQRPPPETLQWVADTVGAGARITSVKRLRGGASTAMHAINVVDSRGHQHRLVLRRFVRSDWLAREPDLAHREASILQLLEDADVPTPKLVAVDGDGMTCDVPAVLMTRLPGRVELVPDDMTSWLTQLASTLPLIHAVGHEHRAIVRPYQPYNDLQKLELPAWSHHLDAWEKAFDLLAGPAPEAPECFIHRDYHPGNVVWSHGQLTGVVDWINASWGPASIDVGHCRLNLATLYDVETADRFLAIHHSLTGRRYEYHPYWDVITAFEFLPDPEVFPGWHDMGLRDLSTELIRSRLDDHVAAAVARL